LVLPGTFFSTESNTSFQIFSRIFNKLERILPIFQILGKSFVSNEIGFDSLLERIDGPISIKGYFQSYKYFEIFSDHEERIQLRDPSAWYLEMEKRISGQQFTSIHIRRGDYLNHRETYGLLSANYYQNAIHSLSQMGKLYQLHVFSDDVQTARDVLKSVVPDDTIWIDPPSGSSAVESLVLMSFASSNIIANSTYSWWGAALNRQNNVVIAPKKWFRSMPDPQFLYPPEWHLIESAWEV
jgi:hypothetical protein